MVSKERLNQLKAQIEDANALGVTNLAEKGVVVAENATTYEIMQGIAEISTSGGGGDTTDYEAMIYEHFGVDKAEYPYLFFYHWNNNNRGTLEVYFAKTFELTSTGVISFQEHLNIEQGSIYPPVLDDTKSVACGVVALLNPAHLKTVASGWVDSKDNNNVTTYTNVVVGETTRYSMVVI